MTITTLTSRAFNQDVGKAKKAAANGPVFITDRGHLAHVLLKIEDYQDLTHKQENIVELLAMPDSDDIDFDTPKFEGSLFKAEKFD